MTNVDPAEEATLFPKTAGEKLREARESEGLSLAEVASATFAACGSTATRSPDRPHQCGVLPSRAAPGSPPDHHTTPAS